MPKAHTFGDADLSPHNDAAFLKSAFSEVDFSGLTWRTRYPLVAPSWVIPGGIWENAVFLAERVDEVALCFFELRPCLEYTEQDLPKELALLPLSWHVHLPFDLPFAESAQGGQQAALAALELMRKIDFLKPVGAVLHPPSRSLSSAEAARRLRDFVESWAEAGRSPRLLWLENTQDSDLLEHEELITKYGLGVCLDIGHVLAYNQKQLLQAKSILKLVKQVHFSLPGVGPARSRHLPFSPIAGLSEAELAERLFFLPDLLKKLPTGTRLQPEIFSWPGYVNSTFFLNRYFRVFC